MNFETIQDFLDYERFSEWLQASDPGLDRFWKDWLKANGDKKELFYNAVSAWLLIREAPRNWSEEGVAAKLSVLKGAITTEPEPRHLRRYWYYAAAVVAFLVILSGIVKLGTRSSSPEERYSGRELFPEEWKSIENNTGRPMLINLPDGSSALLSEKSRLSFHPHFLEHHRIVNLHGEAFFEVVKNASDPFLVHTPTLTTKVLGTSFRVSSFGEEDDSKVTVMTGKVEVSVPRSAEGVFSGQRVVLVRNEEAILPRHQDQLLKSMPEERNRPLPNLPDSYSFNLKFVPAPEIFATLEKMYGVSIIYDAERFRHCTLTANLEDIPFLKKLELVCAGIDAEYTIDGTVVRISGAGCPP